MLKDKRTILIFDAIAQKSYTEEFQIAVRGMSMEQQSLLEEFIKTHIFPFHNDQEANIVIN